MSWTFVAVCSLGSAVGIAMLSDEMAPVKPGRAVDFWRLAIGEEVLSEYGTPVGGTSFHNWEFGAGYALHHFHGWRVYSVSEDEIEMEFERFVASLEEALRRGEESPYLEEYLEWKSDPDAGDSWEYLLTVATSSTKDHFRWRCGSR